MRMREFLPLLFVLGAVLTHAQQPARDPSRQMAASLKAFTVNADRTVTFRIMAPTATEVKVSLGFNMPSTAMTKDDKGVWTATVGPLEPNYYNYAYEIGGARVNQGEFEIAGATPHYDDTQDVPHGTVTTHYYFSKVQSRQRKLLVYLPPQYYTEATRKFPVLYLYHSGEETGWITAGRANNILDNYIAEGKAVPMIVVMPNNNINSGDGTDAVFPAALDNLKVIEQEMLREIMPMVEKDYRTIDDRAHRAIAGLSFGGGTAFGFGMRHLDLIGNVGEFATGTFGGADAPPSGHINYLAWNPDNITPDMYKKLLAPATKPVVFFMAVGDKDPRGPFQKAAYDDFVQHGINPAFKTFPGGHSFDVFRPAMAEFVTLIFK